MTKLHLVSFADGAFSERRHNFIRQAEKLGVFDSIKVHSLATLEADFREAHGEYLRRNLKGFGHYIWKPQALRQTCDIAQPDDLICWLDAGFTINASARIRLGEYVDLALQSRWKMLSFWSVHTEYRFTKADLAVHLGVSNNLEVMGTSQLSSGFFLFCPTPGNRDLIYQWAKLSTQDQYHFSSDSPSARPNHPHFVSHRHDQSIFSLLRKIRGTTATCYETQDYARWFERFKDEFPMWATRTRR